MTDKPEEPIPKCPACGTPCVREKKVLAGVKYELEVWVCPEKRKESCLT